MPRKGRWVQRRLATGRPLRPLEWGSAERINNLAANAQDVSWILSPPEVQLLHEPTLVRTLIQYMASAIPGSAMAVIGAVGIIRWSGDPDTGNIPADAPDPLDDANADWVWHSYLPFAAAGGAFLTLGPGQAAVDIASQRRLSNTEGLLLVVQAPSTLGMYLSTGIRYLLKQ